MDSIQFRISTFEDRFQIGLVDCWRRSLPLDAINEWTLLRRVVLDVNFDPNGLILAIAPDDTVLGFISCFVLKRPIENVGFMEDRGFIQAFGVRPDAWKNGIGSALLNAALEFFKKNDRHMAVLAPYTPNYFVPGVDKDYYTHGLEWLLEKGFAEYAEAFSADANIATYDMDKKLLQKEKELADQGITIRPFTRDATSTFIQFQREFMPGPWIEDARRNLLDMTVGRFPENAIWLAWQSNRIIGFCQHEKEHFGPFGIIEEYQGKGIGSILLARTLLQMRIDGCHSAWVLWTNKRALDGVYGRLGFKLTRRFALLKKMF